MPEKEFINGKKFSVEKQTDFTETRVDYTRVYALGLLILILVALVWVVVRRIRKPQQ